MTEDFMRGTMKCRGSFRIAVLGVIAIICTATVASAASADKGRIAFVSDRTGSWQIYTMDPDGTGQFQVTNLAPNSDDGLFPSISPDGKQILFNYFGPEGVDLYVINADGTGLQSLTQDHQSFFGHWSPDGKKIAFTTISPLGPAVIAVMRADG